MRKKLILNFTPHSAQKKIDKALDTHRFVYVIAGRKFGKSIYALHRSLIEAWKKPNSTIWYLAPYVSQSFEISWMKFLEIIPPEIIEKKREDKKYIMLRNGSIIWVKGTYQESILRGPELQFCVLDEFINMSYYIWEAVLRPMFLVTRGKALFIGTVPDPTIEYVNQDFLDDYEKYLYAPTKDAISFNFTSLDNPYISKEEIDNAVYEAEKKGKKEWAEREYYGKYQREFGLVFPFKYDQHLIQPFEIPEDWTRYMAIDPHPNAPLAALWLAVSPEGRYIVYREFFGENLNLAECAAKILEIEGKEQITKRFIDPTFAQVEMKITGQKSIRDMLAHEGIYTTPASRSFETFYFKALELLAPAKDGLPMLLFFNNLSHITYQITHVEWDIYKDKRRQEEIGGKNRPRKKSFHHLDCLKYIINGNPVYLDKSFIEVIKTKIKEKLASKQFL